MSSNITINTINKYSYNYCPNCQPTKREMTFKQKAVVGTSSALGAGAGLAVLAARKGFSLNPARILKTPLKDLAIFKYQPQSKSIEYGVPEIITVASGSVAGGFAGGVAVDDKINMKAKKRELVNQILGNILTPVACVGAGSSLYSNYANRIENAMPQFKTQNSALKTVNTVLKKLPNAVCTIGLLGIGIYLGNKVSNFLNEKIYNKKVDRNIRVSDFAPHVDDVCMATTMMNKGSTFGAKLGRIIPLALLVPGYETGTARDY